MHTINNRPSPKKVPHYRFREVLLSSESGSREFSSETRLTVDPFFMKALADTSVFTGSEFWGMVENRPVFNLNMLRAAASAPRLTPYDFLIGFHESMQQLFKDGWNIQEIYGFFNELPDEKGRVPRDLPLQVVAELAVGGNVNFVLSRHKEELDTLELMWSSPF